MAVILGALIDPFTAGALNTTVWNANSGTVTLASARVALAATSAGSTLGAAGPYDATGQTLYARVTPALAGTGGQSVTTTMAVQLNGSNQAKFACTPGTVWQAVVVNAGVATTVNLPAFDPAQHAWWRIAESGGQWLFSTSADGAAWTQVAAIAYTWSARSVSVAFSASAPSVTGQTAYVEHVNTPYGAGVTLPSWPQVRFQVAFNTGGTSSVTPAFTDLSSRLRGSWSASPSGRQYELDQVQSGQMTCSLWNLDGALDPTDTASPYYPNVLPMRQCRLQAVWPPTRNLLDQVTTAGINSPNYSGQPTGGTTYGWATGLAPAPTGHTTAWSWILPASTAAGSQFGYSPAVAGTSATPASPDGSALPVVAGQQYTVSGWLALAAGGDTTLQVALQVSWFSATGALLSVSTGTAAAPSVLPTWSARASYAATAPAGAVCAKVSLTNATVPSAKTTVQLTGWQLEQAASASPFTAGGVIQSLWSGYVERWPQTWTQQGTYGLVSLTCIDLLASLSRYTLAASVEQQIMSLGPDFLYPLADPTGSTQFADATGNRGALVTTAAPAGSSGASVTAGSSVTGSGGVGITGPVATMAQPSPGSGSASQAIVLAAPATGPFGPPTTGAWTRLIAFRTTVTPSGAAYLWLAAGPGALSSGQSGSQAYAALYISSSGHVVAAVANASGASNAVSAGNVVTDGAWHLAAITLSADGLTLTCGVDTVNSSVINGSDLHPSGCTSDNVGAQISNGSAFFTFAGDLAYVAEVPATVVNSLNDLSKGIATCWNGDGSLQRANRIMTLAGAPTVVQDAGTTAVMGGAALVGTDAMSALQLVGDSESGQVYVDGAGTLWLAGRKARYIQTSPTITFGENVAGGEVPYLGDLGVDFDPSHVYNTVTVTNAVATGQTAPPAAVVSNAASRVAYTPRALDRTINLQDQTVQGPVARYLSQQYGQPLARVSAVTVDGGSNPAVWRSILGLGFGTRAVVNRRPPAGPGAAQISAQVYVEHLAWSGDDKGRLRLALQLTPAAPYTGWGYVASLHTTLAAPATAGSNTITVNALPGSASNTAAQAIPLGTLVTIGQGQADSELNAVTGVAATSPGYTTVVLTLSGNLANNHAAGEVIAEALYNLPSTVTAGYPTSIDAGATLTATGPRVPY